PDGTFRAVPNGFNNDDQFTLKVDHSFNQNNQLSLYYYFIDGDNDLPFSHFESFSPSVLPGFGTVSKTRTQQASASYTWTVNPTSVNEFRFSWFRNSQGEFLHPKRTNLLVNSCTGAVTTGCFDGNTDTPGVFTPDPKLGITPGLDANREGVPFISVSGG